MVIKIFPAVVLQIPKTRPPSSVMAEKPLFYSSIDTPKREEKAIKKSGIPRRYAGQKDKIT